MKEFLSEYQVEKIIGIVNFHLKYIQSFKYSKAKQREELSKLLNISFPELGRVAVDSKVPRENVCYHCLGTGKKLE
jgi:hypothetical protein